MQRFASKIFVGRCHRYFPGLSCCDTLSFGMISSGFISSWGNMLRNSVTAFLKPSLPCCCQLFLNEVGWFEKLNLAKLAEAVFLIFDKNRSTQ